MGSHRPPSSLPHLSLLLLPSVLTLPAHNVLCLCLPAWASGACQGEIMVSLQYMASSSLVNSSVAGLPHSLREGPGKGEDGVRGLGPFTAPSAGHGNIARFSDFQVLFLLPPYQGPIFLMITGGPCLLFRDSGLPGGRPKSMC